MNTAAKPAFLLLCFHSLQYSLLIATSSYADSRYRNYMGVAHYYNLLIVCTMHDIMANSAVDSNIVVTRLIKYTVYKDGVGLSSDFMLLFILCIICLHMQWLVSYVGNGSEPIVCKPLMQSTSEKPCRLWLIHTRITIQMVDIHSVSREPFVKKKKYNCKYFLHSQLLHQISS